MTAEIALMNKEAVALAADSAVTMSTGSIPKIFSSANKIFSLSKYYPVGIMIYGNAVFMSVPWEIIIKMYRDELGKKSFLTLEEYAGNFLNYLDNGNPLFPESVQKAQIKESIDAYFNYVNNDIIDMVKIRLKEKEQIEDKDRDEIISIVIEKHRLLWEDAEKIPNIASDFETDLINKYNDLIDESIIKIFELLPLSQVQKDNLKLIIVSCLARFSKKLYNSNKSGVVIAGFGESEIFPALISYDLESVLNNKVKFKIFNSNKISYNIGAAVMPFAQSEMVETFMEGVDPKYKITKDSYISQILNKYPEIVVSHIKGPSPEETKELERKLKEASKQLLRDLKIKLDAYRIKHHVNPVINVVAGLPKDELAKMAESLVNLTSFKRRVSQASETVGGPIDVALISKGDGFIWVKRKHYFAAELNPQFRDNYYRRCEENECI